MSISDLIVVMKLGVVQQIDVPQRVYDEPVNLFVAKFLGTPPINVFRGQVRNHSLYIGEERIMEANIDDQDVFVGIRPEGFIYAPEDGVLTCNLSSVEVMGRDSSIVSTNDYAESANIRSIIDADVKVNKNSPTVKFNIKPNKIFLFRGDTEERIYLNQED